MTHDGPTDPVAAVPRHSLFLMRIDHRLHRLHRGIEALRNRAGGRLESQCPRGLLLEFGGKPRTVGAKRRHLVSKRGIALVRAAPPLSDKGYSDCPTPRPNDWGGQVRGVHVDLSRPLDRVFGPAEGGGDLERQPWLPDEPARPRAQGSDIEHALSDDDIDAVRGLATGTFLDQWDKASANVKSLAVRAQSTTRGDVVWTGLVSGDKDSATVIVAATGTAASKTTEFKEEARNYRMQVELVLDKGAWLTSDLQYVP